MGVAPPESPKCYENGGHWNHRFRWFITYLDILETISQLVD